MPPSPLVAGTPDGHRPPLLRPWLHPSTFGVLRAAGRRPRSPGAASGGRRLRSGRRHGPLDRPCLPFLRLAVAKLSRHPPRLGTRPPLLFTPRTGATTASRPFRRHPIPTPNTQSSSATRISPPTPTSPTTPPTAAPCSPPAPSPSPSSASLQRRRAPARSSPPSPSAGHSRGGTRCGRA